MACSTFPAGLIPFGNGPDAFNRVKTAIEIMADALCVGCIAHLASSVAQGDYFDVGFGEVAPEICDKLTVYITDGSNEVYEAIVLDSDAPDPEDRITDWFLIYTESGITGTITGEMRMYAGASAPAGWLLCDGDDVSRTTYSTLFALVGTTFGAGNGTTTFNLPDMRAKVPMGVNNSGLPNGANGALTTRNRAATGGSETHTLVAAELAAHTHGLKASNGAGGVNPTPQGVTANAVNSATISQANTGDTPHANVEPFLVVNFIIKT